jgi:hypothetical protein
MIVRDATARDELNPGAAWNDNRLKYVDEFVAASKWNLRNVFLADGPISQSLREL